MKKNPLILVTNDDGIYSPGLHAAVKAVQGLGDVIVVAPAKQQTGMGRAFPRTEQLGVIEKVDLKIDEVYVEAYKVDGSPAYTVAFGVLELAKRKPDLCVSGINYGENVGLTLTCSGTLGAVFEADSHDIPGIAVSLETDVQKQRTEEYDKMDWSSAIAITRKWAEKMLNEKRNKKIKILNINIPNKKISDMDYRITRLDRVNYYEFTKPQIRDFSKPFELQSKLSVNVSKLKSNGDVHAVYVDRVTSVTPLGWDLSFNISEENMFLNTI